ncbi:MAG TPA: arsenate reductase ArsC [Pyrinomonadaceae bacterium]|jgi:arsenate reductase|nr:arsenate reductase ArsC [Pyrinomonadaceae bacterium]
MAEKKRVLVICTGNVARSQMAEGLLRHLADDKAEVFSAGLIPSYVRPNAIAVMKEVGIDISHHRSKSLNEFIDTPFDYVITVCDHAAQYCPTFPGEAKRIHWSIRDPVVIGDDEAQLQAFRSARDDLKGRIEKFVTDELA